MLLCFLSLVHKHYQSILNPQDDNAKLSTRLRLAEECVADCEQERHVMHATVDRLRACLEASETCCKGQLEQLGQVGAFQVGGNSDRQCSRVVIVMHCL